MIEVIRVLRYTYPDFAHYEKDRMRWTPMFRMNGVTDRVTGRKLDSGAYEMETIGVNAFEVNLFTGTMIPLLDEENNDG